MNYKSVTQYSLLARGAFSWQQSLICLQIRQNLYEHQNKENVLSWMVTKVAFGCV